MAKICIYLHSLNAGGGVQERRVELANEWVTLGHDVTIVCPIPPERPINKLSNNIRIEFLGKWSKRHRNNILFGFMPLVKFFKREGNFDAVLAGTPLYIFITSMALKWAENSSPLYGTVHNPFVKTGGIKHKIFTFLGKYCLTLSSNRVTHFAGVSQGIALQISSILKLTPQHVQVIYNPVIKRDWNYLDMLASKRCQFKTSFKKTILAIGRLDQQKGFDLLLDAVARMPKKNWHLLIVGEGPELQSLKAKTKQLNLEGQVSFLGYRNDILELMTMAHCFVLSSRWEGFGNVLAEALYAQLPVVSFNCPYGPSEILGEGRWGELVPAGDVLNLAIKIEQTLDKGCINENTRWKDFFVPSIAQKYLTFMGIRE